MENTHTKPCKRSAYSYAVKLLSKKDYSEFKLRTKLLEKNFTDSEANEAIEELISKKFLREDYYIEARVKGLMHKGYSPTHIQNRLKEEQVEASMSVIQDTFNEYKLTEEEQVEKLIIKKLGNSAIEAPLEFNAKMKLLRFLASKGHCGEIVDQVLSNIRH